MDTISRGSTDSGRLSGRRSARRRPDGRRFDRRRSARRRSASRWATAGLLAALAGAAGWLALAGGSVWPLAVSAALAVAAGVAGWAGWTLGVAAGAVLPLAAESFAVHVFPALSPALGSANAVLLLVVTAAGLALLLPARRFRLPGGAAWLGLAAAAVVPVALGAFFATLPTLRDGNALSWAMRNDAVWNLVTARFVLTDGRLAPDLHPNPSPLTAVLLAAGMAPGRPGAGEPGLLQHDVAAMAGVLALSTVAAALLAGLVVARTVSPAHPLLRSLGAVLASALIASWFVAGFTFQLGFYNAMPTIACLLACWLAWLGSARRPAVAVAVLLVGATALLALWAFLALIPAALAAAAALRWIVVKGERRRVPIGWGGWIVVALGAAQLAAYVLLFSLPDLSRNAGALAQGGSMAPVTPALLFVLVGIALAVTGATATRPAARSDLLGVLAIAVAATAVYLYLGREVRPGAYGWGYYPAKLVWFSGILLLVVVLGLVLDRVARVPLGAWSRVAAVTGTIVALIAVAASVLPKPPQPGALVPYIDIADGTGVASGDDVLPTLFALPDPAEAKTMLVGYDDWRVEGFANSWLLGASAADDRDPIRGYAYELNTTDREAVCDAVRAWGDGVVIRTRVVGLAAQLQAQCPAVDVTVVVGAIR